MIIEFSGFLDFQRQKKIVDILPRNVLKVLYLMFINDMPFETVLNYFVNLGLNDKILKASKYRLTDF